MDTIKNMKEYKTVRAFKTLIVMMSIVYVLGFLSACLLSLKELFSFLKQGGSFIPLVLYIQFLFQIGVFFWILYNLSKLLAQIKKNRIFDAGNSRIMERVAYGAFALAVISIGGALITSLGHGRFEVILGEILGNGLQLFLLGMGILVIALVFKVGTRMKNEQDLTV